MYWERRATKNLFYISKKDENQYINNVALLYYIIIYDQRKIPSKNIIKEEKEILSSKSDSKSKLNNNKDLYLYQTQKKLKLNLQIKNMEIVFCENIIYSSQITSVKLFFRLQRNKTQIGKDNNKNTFRQ